MIVDLTLSAPPGTDEASTTQTPTPQDPLPGMSDDSTEITAGLGGFLVVFALGLAVWFLGRDLTRRLRRMSRAEEQRVVGRQPDGTQERPGGQQRTGREDEDPDHKDPIG